MQTFSFIVAIVLISCGAQDQWFVTSPSTRTEVTDAIGSSGRVLELQIPERNANGTEVLQSLLDRQRTASTGRIIDQVAGNNLRQAVAQVLRRSAPVAPQLFQVESAFRFEEPDGQALLLICKSCQQPLGVIAKEVGDSVSISHYFRIDSVRQLLDQVSPQFRAAPTQRPVMPLPRN